MRTPGKERLRFLEETSREYEIALTENPEVQNYLTGRGLSTRSVDLFRLGYVADPPPEHERYRGRLAIPIIKGVGIVAFKFRCLRPECMVAEKCEGHAKFLATGTQLLYNVTAIDEAENWIVIAEGEPDTWILHGEVGVPTVGMPSASAWKPHWTRLLSGFRDIYFWPDRDAHLSKDVGGEAAEKVKKELPQTTILELPILEEGKKTDVSKAYNKLGQSFFLKQLPKMVRT